MDADSINGFKVAVVDCAETYGLELASGIEEKSTVLIGWLDYLRACEKTEVASELLDGVQAAIVESAGCLAMGLVRPALFSLRAQVDMLLSWMFFKDHAIEWHHVEEFGKGFKLKSEVTAYLQDYYPQYKRRFATLLQGKRRREEDPYRVLSAHIHSQSSATIPSVSKLEQLVSGIELARECVDMQSEVAEYLSDILMACYAQHWAALPADIVSDVKARLNPAQQSVLFAS